MTRLHRYYGNRHLHFITTSCFQRRALLGTARRRTLLLEILEQVRRRYPFVLVNQNIGGVHQNNGAPAPSKLS